ncbi:unnamed protein product [Orchesella dallaii]|uniref:C2H2-type domain-containing protein n=1 Tax=Orchesella dallaii TaxID=48710 RepID=A0ABP1PX73_9HEXA
MANSLIGTDLASPDFNIENGAGIQVKGLCTTEDEDDGYSIPHAGGIPVELKEKEVDSPVHEKKKFLTFPETVSSSIDTEESGEEEDVSECGVVNRDSDGDDANDADDETDTDDADDEDVADDSDSDDSDPDDSNSDNSNSEDSESDDSDSNESDSNDSGEDEESEKDSPPKDTERPSEVESTAPAQNEDFSAPVPQGSQHEIPNLSTLNANQDGPDSQRSLPKPPAENGRESPTILSEMSNFFENENFQWFPSLPNDFDSEMTMRMMDDEMISYFARSTDDVDQDSQMSSPAPASAEFITPPDGMALQPSSFAAISPPPAPHTHSTHVQGVAPSVVDELPPRPPSPPFILIITPLPISLRYSLVIPNNGTEPQISSPPPLPPSQTGFGPNNPTRPRTPAQCIRSDEDNLSSLAMASVKRGEKRKQSSQESSRPSVKRNNAITEPHSLSQNPTTPHRASKTDGYTSFREPGYEALFFKCVYCPAFYKRKSRIISHAELHLSPDKIRICPVKGCGWYVQARQIWRHWEEKHPDLTARRCGECQFLYVSKEEGVEHQKLHDSGEGVSCPKCGCLVRRETLESHEMECHPYPNQSQSQRKRPLKRDKDTPSTSARILKKHKHFCPTCPFSASRTSHLKRHLLVHKSREEDGGGTGGADEGDKLKLK